MDDTLLALVAIACGTLAFSFLNSEDATRERKHFAMAAALFVGVVVYHTLPDFFHFVAIGVAIFVVGAFGPTASAWARERTNAIQRERNAWSNGIGDIKKILEDADSIEDARKIIEHKEKKNGNKLGPWRKDNSE